MISRRLIRIKVFKVLFSRINSSSDSLKQAENELLLSCNKTLELYYFLLSLPLAVRGVAINKIESGLKKFHPTEQESNPNMRFVNNRFLEVLDNDKELRQFCSKNGLNWNDYPAFVKQVYNSFQQSEYFNRYMSNPECCFNDDLKVIVNFFEQELEDNPELETILEDANLYWNDDLAYVINVILKRVKSFDVLSTPEHPQVFLKEDDRDYALKLLNLSMIHYEQYTQLLAKYVLNWETDRLASTDIALIVLGITEAVSFRDIPLKVTINEYVELSKYYSTPNSKVFVNGMLDKILLALKEEGKIEKSGRGLVGSAE